MNRSSFSAPGVNTDLFQDFPRTFSLYIHVPFCRNKCSYCDFYSLPVKKNTEEFFRTYTAFLGRELDLYGKILSSKRLQSIYLGGGTPSLFSPELLAEVLVKIQDHFSLSAAAEITLEANPESLTEKKIQNYVQLGVNRISLGVQSFQDQELSLLGRCHTADRAHTAAGLLQNSRVNFNIDLIFAFPGHTVKSWSDTLDQALQFAPDHVSIYNLELKKGTPLADQIEAGEREPTTEEIDLQMYKKARFKLIQAGYDHYEISNFAHPDRQSVHNKIYWQYRPYLGLGPAAHGFSGQKRYYNTDSLETYYSRLERGKLPGAEVIDLSKQDLRAEKMMMGLRLLRGVSKEEFADRFAVNLEDVYGLEIEKLKRQGLLGESEKRVFLTDKGIFLGNRVFQEFLP